MRLIDADAFKKILSEHEMEHDKRRSFDDYAWGASNAYEHASDLLDEMPTVDRPHGEWVHTTVGNTEFINCKNCGCGCPLYSYVKKGEKEEKVQHYETDFCPNCGASVISSNSKIEKSKSEIENSNLPERFTATDCSCLNCKNRHSVHCEPQNKKIYGYCGNWERR